MLLKTTPGISYVGNIEGREIMLGDVNVAVSDGYTGNIALKSIEGTGKAFSKILKTEFKKNIFTKLGYLFASGVMKKVKNRLDYEKVGGAMFLGLPGAVVKGHGNSKALGFSVCISQAAEAVRGGMVEKIKDMLGVLNAQEQPVEENV